MITRVEITGFRGIPGTRTFKPEMLTILTGRNGFGKTTFFDAIDWCLFGPSSRFGGDISVLHNLYSKKHTPNVEVTLEIDQSPITVRRTSTNVYIDDRAASERDVADALIVDPDVFPPYLRELGNQVKSVTYLSQDQIRDFVTTSLSSERKALLRGLLGVPNAGVMESSIRRVTDHLVSREKDLLATATSLEDLHAEAQDAPSFDDSLEVRVAEFVARTSSRAARALLTLDGSREWLEASVAKAEGLRDVVEGALSTIREAAQGVQQADRELADLQKRRIDIVERLKHSESEVIAATAALQQTQTNQQAALQARSDVERRMAEVAEHTRLETRAADLQQQLVAAAKERQLAEAFANGSRASLESARSVTEAAERQLSDLEAQLTKYEEQSRVIRERAECESRLVMVRSKAADGEAAVAEAKRALSTVTVAADSARAALNDAMVVHGLEEASAQRSARLAELRAQMKKLLRDADTMCPTCGAQYESHADLLGHIDSMGVSVGSGLASASATVDQRKREDANAQGHYTKAVTEHDRLERELAALRAEESQWVSRLEVLPSLDELVVGGSIPDDVARVRIELTTLKERLSSESTGASKASQALERATEAQAVIVRELELLRERVPAANVELVESSNEDVRSELVKAEEAMREAEQAVQRRRHDLTALETLAADTKAALAAIDGRLAAENDRRARLLDSIAREAQRSGVELSSSDPGDPSASVAHVEDSLLGLATRYGEALNTNREELEQAKSLQRRQGLNEAASNRRDRLAQLAEIEKELETLRSARDRFLSIASRIEERSKSEAAKAGGQHLAAIQECIDDLYPHTHLNTVEVDFTEGEMFIRDRWLENGVRPRDYASTGQSNVLALSVFLGLSLRQTFSRIRSVLMDEPVQNLDDLHFLAFLTLIKRVALTRQVILSTADSNIAQIFARQLSAWSDQGRGWCEYEWTGFEPQSGPVIRRHSGRRRAVA